MKKHILLEDLNIVVHIDTIQMAQPRENPTLEFKSEVLLPYHGWCRCEMEFDKLAKLILDS